MAAEPGDTCLICHRQEQLTKLKAELRDVLKTLLSLHLDDGDEQIELQSALSCDVFNHSLKLEHMVSAIESATSSTQSSTPDSKGVKLPKTDVPIFNGNILNWKTLGAILYRCSQPV